MQEMEITFWSLSSVYFCVFSKIRPGERPVLTDERDMLLLAAIRRVNLDSFWSRATGTVDGTR
jgi:hypothetical protein